MPTRIDNNEMHGTFGQKNWTGLYTIANYCHNKKLIGYERKTDFKPLVYQELTYANKLCI